MAWAGPYVFERATRRTYRTGWNRFQSCSTHRSRQEQALGILRSGKEPVGAQRLRLHVLPALPKKHHVVCTGTPFSPWPCPDNLTKSPPRIGFSSKDHPYGFALHLGVLSAK